MSGNSFTPVRQQERAVGLDVTRSLAIGIVLLCHGLLVLYGALFPLNASLTTTGVLLGYYGVELFFVLSGFLIGGILLTEVLPAPGIASIGRFFLRRWLRILPAYYAVLILLMALERAQGLPLLPRWDYFFFLQNYDQGAEHFFPVSWSLTIEQWSYVLAPLVLLALPRLFSRLTPLPHRRIGYSLLAVFCLFIFLRLATGLFTDAAWDVGIRKQIHLRLDAVFFGVLLVSCQHFRPALYNRLASLPVFLAVLMALVWFIRLQAAFMLAHNSPGGPDASLFFKSLGFTLTDFLLALTLPFFASHRSFAAMVSRTPALGCFFAAGSRYAYSLYLVHFAVFVSVRKVMTGLEPLSFPPRALACGLGGIAALLLSVAAAMVIYRCFEKPGMDLRTHFKGAEETP